MISSTSTSPRFALLEHADFRRLKHAAYLKGLLRPFKGKGELEIWASECFALRDDLIEIATEHVLAQAQTYPFSRLSAHLTQHKTGAGTTFLRWRNPDRSLMGVGLWERLIQSPSTPAWLVDDLYAMERQRVALNMQVSLTHHLARCALDCAGKMAWADAAYQQRIDRA